MFSGCGGLSVGLSEAGWKGLFAIEKNSDAFSTFKHNLIDADHFSWPDWLEVGPHDIDEINYTYKKELQKLKGKVLLVAGGPPCQGFSLAGKRDKNDARNKLVDSYIDFVRMVEPEVLLLENVRGFTVQFDPKNHGRNYSQYVKEELETLGYQCKSMMVNMSEFGIPQKRVRFILLAMRSKDPQLVFDELEQQRSSFLKKKGFSSTVSVSEAIGDLEKGSGTVPCPDTNGFLSGLYGESESPYQKWMRQEIKDHPERAVDSHRFVNHQARTIKLHKDLQKKAPVGKRITPRDKLVENLKRRGVTVLDEDQPAPTITSIPDELVHYSEPRILTVREHARIQSFPDWFEFKGKYTSGGSRRKLEVPRYTQVANAVPPLFAEQIGQAIKKVLEDDNG